MNILDYVHEYGSEEGFRMWHEAAMRYLDAHPDVERYFRAVNDSDTRPNNYQKEEPQWHEAR